MPVSASLANVRLLPGPVCNRRELNTRYLLELEPEQLLHTFRLQAGLPSSAEPLGGWEAPACGLRGHFVGHYLSACAQAHASTGDSRLRERLELAEYVGWWLDRLTPQQLERTCRTDLGPNPGNEVGGTLRNPSSRRLSDRRTMHSDRCLAPPLPALLSLATATRDGKRRRAPHSKASLRAADGLSFPEMTAIHWAVSSPRADAGQIVSRGQEIGYSARRQPLWSAVLRAAFPFRPERSPVSGFP